MHTQDQTPLVNRSFRLEKFPGKGGWTYAKIPEILQNKNAPFGWVVVRGFIDTFELKHYKLMPMGENKLFLPVKATIRKKIKKEAGDTVHIKLYRDDPALDVPPEIMDCFGNEDKKLLAKFFTLLPNTKQKHIDWIYKAKNDEEKALRIIELIDYLKML